jgi:hypothetical protein
MDENWSTKFSLDAETISIQRGNSELVKEIV